MKWFKHDADASIDAKLQEILLDYGATGYGLYWYCVELIAKDVTPKNITFELEHDARVIARNLNLSVKEVQDIMQKMVEVGLFDITKNNKIACVKLAYRLDDSMRKGRQVDEILSAFHAEHEDLVGKIPKNSGSFGIIPNESGKYLPDIDKETDKETDKDKLGDESPIHTKPKKSGTTELLAEYGIVDELANDFIAHRKNKKAPITKTAMNGFVREAEKAGISIEDAVRISIEKNWQGFNASWEWGDALANIVKPNQNKNNKDPTSGYKIYGIAGGKA